MKKAKKTVLLGIDGLMTELVEKFVSEGCMPFTKNLLEVGLMTRAIESIPADTPTNWTTVITGADTGTHGVTGFFTHEPGMELDCSHFNSLPADSHSKKLNNSFSSNICKAERLWEAAQKQGLRSLVIEYPMAWPPTFDNGIVFGTEGVTEGGQSIAGPAHYCTGISKNDIPVIFTPVQIDGKGCLEGFIPAFPQTGLVAWDAHGQKIAVAESDSDIAGGTYRITITSENMESFDTVSIYRNDGAASPLTVLRAGSWSGWIREVFYRNDQEIAGYFRYKLIRLSPGADEFILYRTSVVTDTGFVYPESLCRKIMDITGPYIKGFDVMYDFSRDEETAMEHIEMGAKALADVTACLAANEKWDILTLHIHFPDHLNHNYIRDIEESFSDYNPEKARHAYDIYRRAYIILDDFLKKTVTASVDDETLLLVLSDHAAFPVKRLCCSLLPEFIKEGLISFKQNENSDHMIDWTKTKAWINEKAYYYAWVNLKGRDPHGIVEPGEEYEQVRDKIIETLRNIKDESTGIHPIILALRSEEAAIFGNHGDRCGDVVFLYEKGYDTDYIKPDPREDPSGVPVFKDSTRQGGHSPCLPTIRFNNSSLAAVVIMKGPGITKNCRLKMPVRLIDITPTICSMMGIDPPSDAEGSPIFI